MSKDTRQRNLDLFLQIILAVIQGLSKAPKPVVGTVSFLAGLGASFYPSFLGFLSA